jgi:cellulose synthase/poly-beta-1,6-N-acetylglucosamine synthase-like glycosyltransferase
MHLILQILFSFYFFYMALSTCYLLILAFSYFFKKEKILTNTTLINRFAIIIPAHNEEFLIRNICESILQINYPRDFYELFVVADNCTDKTAKIVREYPINLLERNDLSNIGKGQALAWAFKKISLDHFDAVFIVDADNYVDSEILNQLNKHINNGEVAIQCYNGVGNRYDSWFTQLLYVSRVISNTLYHEAKYRLGLSSYLMGNGLSFKSELLQQKGWTAFSTGEDWEYYAQLVESGIRVGFASRAKVFHQESCSLNQATSQRLRWSSGRFKIARTLGFSLFLKGIRERNWWIIDASFPLLFPNYSLLFNLTLAGLFLSLLATYSVISYFVISFSALLVGQILLFIAGTIIAGSPLKVFRAALYAPIFLIWKGSIDFLSVTGLYRNKKWVRTARH